MAIIQASMNVLRDSLPNLETPIIGVRTFFTFLRTLMGAFYVTVSVNMVFNRSSGFTYYSGIVLSYVLYCLFAAMNFLTINWPYVVFGALLNTRYGVAYWHEFALAFCIYCTKVYKNNPPPAFNEVKIGPCKMIFGVPNKEGNKEGNKEENKEEGNKVEESKEEGNKDAKDAKNDEWDLTFSLGSKGDFSTKQELKRIEHDLIFVTGDKEGNLSATSHKLMTQGDKKEQ